MAPIILLIHLESLWRTWVDYFSRYEILTFSYPWLSSSYHWRFWINIKVRYIWHLLSKCGMISVYYVSTSQMAVKMSQMISVNFYFMIYFKYCTDMHKKCIQLKKHSWKLLSSSSPPKKVSPAYRSIALISTGSKMTVQLTCLTHQSASMYNGK